MIMVFYVSIVIFYTVVSNLFRRSQSCTSCNDRDPVSSTAYRRIILYNYNLLSYLYYSVDIFVIRYIQIHKLSFISVHLIFLTAF